MLSAFTSALSAMKAHSAAVDIVGHNLANVNTSGYKAVEVAFKDLVSQSMGGGAEMGMGVAPPHAVRNFTQGAIQSTSGAMNAAIQGNGLFVVRNDSESEGLQYTRDGSFQVDRTGILRTLSGERVQGFQVAADGTRSAVLGDIIVPPGTSTAKPTGNMSIYANLNANAPDGTAFNSTVEVIDSIGKSHVITVTFTKTGANEWEMQAAMPEGETGNADFAELAGSTPIALTFDGTGTLTAPALADDGIPITLTDLNSGADDLTVSMKFWDVMGSSTITQSSSPSSTSRTTQDGILTGQITEVGMADGGKVVARYSSGEERTIAMLGIAITSNPGSLTAVSDNLFRVSSDTADPVVGLAGEGGRGRVKAQSLEASTVDIAREFTNLIIFQRGYQANSRVVTTADEISQETLNLKR